MQISIIIVNYNVKYFLEQCLLSVQQATKHLQAEVFVVDNASSDDSVSYLTPKFSWVNFISSKNNLGFAKANNLALQQAKGDYILFLNPDTIISEQCLKESIGFLKTDDSKGATGIYMLDGTGAYLPESKRAFPEPLTSLYKLFGFTQFFPKHKTFAKYYLGHLNQNQNNEIDVLSGAFILVKKNIVEKTQGFDESFFMYGEDIDLSYRIQQLGFKNYCFVDAPIIHFKGESTKKNNVFYLKTFYKAMEQFVNKHYENKSSKLFSIFLKFGIWLRATIALVLNFLKLSAPLLLDVFCIGTSVVSTYFFSKFIYQVSLNFAVLIWSALCFLISYCFLNFWRNSYLKAMSIKRMLGIILVATFIAQGITLFYFNQKLIALLWGQVAITFFILRYVLSIKLIKREILQPFASMPMQEQMLIVSSTNEFNKVYKILQNNNLSQVITGRVTTDVNDSFLSVGHVNELPLLLKNYPVKDIVFVASQMLSYNQIINLVKNLPANLQYYFYNAKAGAIISSSSKNLSGQIFIDVP